MNSPHDVCLCFLFFFFSPFPSLSPLPIPLPTTPPWTPSSTSSLPRSTRTRTFTSIVFARSSPSPGSHLSFSFSALVCRIEPWETRNQIPEWSWELCGNSILSSLPGVHSHKCAALFPLTFLFHRFPWTLSFFGDPDKQRKHALLLSKHED